MKKASEYREHAQECRALASRMEVGDQRDQLLAMAANWDALATERSDLVRRHPEVGMVGEHVEEMRRDEPPEIAARPPASSQDSTPA